MHRTLTTTDTFECPCCRELGERDDDGTPVAEKEQRFYGEEDWDGLIALRERLLARRPDEPHCILRLAEVHAAAGNPEKSLEVAARGYAEHPDDLWLEDAVLDALFALGRTEEDFDWPGGTPPVLRLGEQALAEVYDFAVRNHREFDEPTDVYLAYHMLQDQAYLPFGPEELLEAVRADARFIVEGEPERPWASWIRAAGSGEPRRRHQ